MSGPYDGVHRFDIGAGKSVVRGKAYWPNMLTVAMGRRDALDVLASLSRQLAGDRASITLVFSGELTEDDQ